MYDPADRPHTPEETERVIDELAWLAEERWWRENYQDRPYVTRDRSFDDYRPAYRYGFESATNYHGRDFNEVEPQLRAGWDRWEHRPRKSNWDEVREMVRDAWDHMRGREHDDHIDRTKM